MEITITRATPWSRALDAARWTMGKDGLDKEPSDKFKTNILMAQHSPIRMVEYDIKIKGIPYCNAVHLIRHHIGVEKFQCSLRDDRNEEIDDRRKLPQDYPVNLWLSCNADALIAISRKRLCYLADVVTRRIWNAVRKEMQSVDPIMYRFMVSECLYRAFCPENPDNCCGFVRTMKFKKQLEEYRQGFFQPIEDA